MSLTHEFYNLNKIRQAIPALSQIHHQQPVAYFNGPGGTQVPRCVPEAMSHYLFETNSNLGAPFPASQRTAEIMEEARRAVAAFFHAKDWREISFGLNMTSVVFQFSRALANTWKPGDNIILTELEHDSNLSPWILAAQEKGVEIRYWPIELNNITLNLEDLAPLLDARTRLVAMTMASNLVGSIVDVALATRMAKQVGANVFIDATHACAHMPIDVQAMGCDFMACSGYKFSGPHVGIFYGRQESMQEVPAYKTPYAADNNPSKWELGTQNFESLAGLSAILKYKAKMVGDGALTTENLHAAMQAIYDYERQLISRFLTGLNTNSLLSNFDRYGLFSLEDLHKRTPTFALSIKHQSPNETAHLLAQEGLFTAGGSFHCSGLVQRMGREKAGGVLRIGFAYYTTEEEIDRLLDAMARCVRLQNTTCALAE